MGKDLLDRINAIPHDELPEGIARDILVAAFITSKLIDVYTSGDKLVIEYPLDGRNDNRWPVAEWRIWCEAGCNAQKACDLCEQKPVTFLAYNPLDAGPANLFICYRCDQEIRRRGGSQAITLCTECHLPGLTVGSLPSTICSRCIKNKGWNH